MSAETSPEQRFDRVVEALLGVEGVEPPAPSRREFGANALKVGGKIFAMVIGGGHLVVKLPARRVDEAIAHDLGRPWDAGKGRPFREWLAVPPD
jgi:hypothetical protein